MVKTFIVPKGQRIERVTTDGTIVLAPKGRKSGPKTPLSTRKKMAKAAKKLKAPMGPILTVGLPIVKGVITAKTHADPRMSVKALVFLRSLLASYTGFQVSGGTPGAHTVSWDWKNAVDGGLPLAALIIDGKFIGARKYINQQLGRANIPIIRA